jgi:hypothetical protein
MKVPAKQHLREDVSLVSREERAARAPCALERAVLYNGRHYALVPSFKIQLFIFSDLKVVFR